MKLEVITNHFWRHHQEFTVCFLRISHAKIASVTNWSSLTKYQARGRGNSSSLPHNNLLQRKLLLV